MSKPKTRLRAYLWWFFLGSLGAHRFYLRRKRTAFALAGFTIAATVLDLALYEYATGWLARHTDMISLSSTILLWVVLITDAFRLPKWVDDINGMTSEATVFD